MDEYLHNSEHKDFIRTRWVEYIKDLVDPDQGLSIITFPAEEMHDLNLFKEEGLIEWEETETGGYRIVKGKVICFEKRTKIFMRLREKLVGAQVLPDELGSFLRSKYQGIMEGSPKFFPVDVVNLDYDGNISKNRVSIEEKVRLIFEFQANHGKNFSLFLTWPSTEGEDEEEYKNLLSQTIKNNLSDPSATIFKESFEAKFDDIESLSYDDLSIIGITKICFRRASICFYELQRNELYTYGEENRHKMYSILLEFKYVGNSKGENELYSEYVGNALNEITKLANDGQRN